LLTRGCKSLFVVLLLFSLNTQASVWLLRIGNNHLIEQHITAPPIFSFSDGDSLYSLDPGQLAEINLQQLFAAPEFRYLEVSHDISGPQSVTRTLTDTQQSQDFLQQDGFAQLPLWQRECDAVAIAIIDSGVDMTHTQLQSTVFIEPFDARCQ